MLKPLGSLGFLRWEPRVSACVQQSNLSLTARSEGFSVFGLASADGYRLTCELWDPKSRSTRRIRWAARFLCCPDPPAGARALPSISPPPYSQVSLAAQPPPPLFLADHLSSLRCQSL